MKTAEQSDGSNVNLFKSMIWHLGLLVPQGVRLQLPKMRPNWGATNLKIDEQSAKPSGAVSSQQHFRVVVKLQNVTEKMLIKKWTQGSGAGRWGGF